MTTGDGTAPAADDTGLPPDSVLPAFRVRVDPAMREPFVRRLLARAEAGGWEASYEQADEDIYLLRSRGDAALMNVDKDGDGAVVIDASDARMPEFCAFAEAVRASLRDDADRITITAPLTANDAGVAAGRLAPT